MLGVGLGLTARAGQQVGGSASGPGGILVFALLGQSNMIGRAAFDGGSVHPEGVQQWGRTGAADGTLIPASVPLDHVGSNSGDMGLDISLAEELLSTHQGSTLVFVPCAEGGAGFQTGHWRPDSVRYLDAVARINAVMAAVPGADLAGFLWHQGESDAGNATFQSDLDTLITGLRQDVLAADETTPFVLGGMVPGWVAVDPGREAVQAVLEDTPARHAHIGFVPADDLTGAGTDVHFTAAELRTLGTRYADAWRTSLAPHASGQIPDQTDPPGLPAPNTSGQIPDQTDPQGMPAPQVFAPIPDQEDTLP